jgi:EpsI family protein
MSGALQGLFVAGACIAFYAPMFPGLIKEWYEHENFSYGFLIPFIFGYLLWQQRDIFRNPSFAPRGWGAASFCFSLVLGLTGKILGEPFIYRLSFVLAIASLFHLFWGAHALRRAAFPLAFLLLMVPPPYPIVKEVSYYLRMSDAWIAQNIAQALGVPVYRDGHMLQLPNITLEVADVCSGIASLFAMIALGTIYIHHLTIRPRLKLVVFGGVLLFPVIANLFRIVLVTVSVYYYGPIMLQAFFHKFTGTFTFMLSVILLLWLGESIRKRYPWPRTAISPQRSNSQSYFDSGCSGTGQYSRGAAILLTSAGIAVLALLFARYQFSGVTAPDVPQRDLDEAVASIGPYRAKYNSPSTYSDPHAERTVSAVYDVPGNRQVELFVGYIGRQFDENRLQSPKLVFPKGWEYVSLENVRVPISQNATVDAAGLVIKSATQTKFVLFWYQVRGSSFAGDFRNRLELMKGWALYGRTDGAVIRLATPVADLESFSSAKNRLILFSQALYPLLQIALPK